MSAPAPPRHTLTTYTGADAMPRKKRHPLPPDLDALLDALPRPADPLEGLDLDALLDALPVEPPNLPEAAELVQLLDELLAENAPDRSGPDVAELADLLTCELTAPSGFDPAELAALLDGLALDEGGSASEPREKRGRRRKRGPWRLHGGRGTPMKGTGRTPKHTGRGRSWRRGKAKTGRNDDARNVTGRRGGQTPTCGPRWRSYGAGGSGGAGRVRRNCWWTFFAAWRACRRAVGCRRSGVAPSGSAPGCAGTGARPAPIAATATPARRDALDSGWVAEADKTVAPPRVGTR